MAVFIAICDDNPADRKQFERLLDREKDERLKSNDVIYFDTYGSEEALLPYCTKYDVFLIDIALSSRDGMMAAADLMNHGAEGSMILCASSVDYEAKYGPADNVIYLRKPLYKKDFKAIVDHAERIHAGRIPKLELRGEKDTIYVLADEIIYAREMRYYTMVALTGDRSFHIIGELDRLRSMLSGYSSFIEIKKGTLINMKNVVSHSGMSFKMSDGAVLRYSIFAKPFISRAYASYAASKIDRR